VSARALLVLLLCVPVGLGAADATPRLALDPESWDFGRTLKNRVIEKQFTLKNVGDADLVIERISTTCGCAAALLSEKTLAPGKSAVLRVTFDTRDLEGQVERKVLLRTNDRSRDPLEIKLQATVVRQ
jgi:phage FluMu protein gp41